MLAPTGSSCAQRLGLGLSDRLGFKLCELGSKDDCGSANVSIAELDDVKDLRAVER